MLEHFPQRWFTDADGDQILMTNLCRRVAIPKAFKDNAALYLSYTIRDGESARDIAERIYDDSELFWVIYLVNNIHNVMDQWPIRAKQIRERLLETYGWEGMDAIHHYEDANGHVTDLHALRLRIGDLAATEAELTTRFRLQSHTIEEFYQSANDTKRTIRLIDPDHVSQFKAKIEELLNE